MAILTYDFEHKGWLLVETGHNYYSACKGNRRVGIGSIHNGDKAKLMMRFRRKVDEMEVSDGPAQSGTDGRCSETDV